MMKNELLIFGEIPFEQNAPNSPLWVRNRLAKMDFSANKELLVRINSEGGDVDNGFAIYNILRELSDTGVKVTTEIDGRLASIATVIFLAGDYRIGNSYFAPFVHSAWVSGSIDQHSARMFATELAKTDARIAELYATVTKGTKSQFLEMMKNETFIDAQTALDLRFFHEIKKISKPKNSMTFLNQIKNTLRPLFGIKNLMFYTADQREVEVDTEAPMAVIGDAVKIDGQKPENGEYVMDSGLIWVIEDGKISEIKDPETPAPENKADDEDAKNAMAEIANGMAALNEKFEELSAKNTTLSEENTELKASIETISNKLVDADKAIKAFKNLKGETVDDKKEDTPKVSALDKYRK